MTQDELKAKHPLLYIYCECGDGWLGLIDEFFANVEAHCRDKKKKNWPVFAQIKEKFGGLRIYVLDYGDADRKITEGLISEYEDMSWEVCHACGRTPARLVGKGWVETLCWECEGEKP